MRESRINQLLNYIRKSHYCSYEDICKTFNISMSTARRDINTLVQNNSIHKVYGGVSANPGTSMLNDSILTQPKPVEDDKSHLLDIIGMKAASFVKPGDLIYIGSGATTYHILPYLESIPDITIVTNNLLASSTDITKSREVILVGGSIDNYAHSTVGIQALDALSSFNFNKAFISCNGFSISTGFCNLSLEEVAIKKRVFEISEKVYMCADSTKCNRISLYTFATFDDVTGFITDSQPTQEYIDAFNEAGTQVFY